MKAFWSIWLLSSAPVLAQDFGSLPFEEQVRRAQLHYLAAIEEIEEARPVGLSTEQSTERARLVRELYAYVERAEFGRNEQFPGARMPHFVDREGRRCAVAELMHRSDLDAIVADVHARANRTWVCELAGVEPFEDWLLRSGLSLREAARIQGPPHLPPTTTGSDTNSGAGGGGTWRGPGDTTPSGGSRGSGASSSPAASSGGAVQTGAVRPAAAGPATGGGPSLPGLPTTVGLTTTSDDGWWLWWEYNKVEFLRPNRLDFSFLPVTGDDPAGALRRAAEAARQQVLPLFRGGLVSPTAEIRAASAIALGRAGGKEAVDALVKLLDDPNLEVRQRAILALGATGSVAAAGPLLAIARTGVVNARTTQRIAPSARAFAIVALGLMRADGFEPAIDSEIVQIVRERSGTDRESVAVAALVYQTLAPNSALERVALELAQDERESPSVRCRAAEALRGASDEATLGRLQHLLNGPRLDLRRSAALALGTYANELSLPALQTAFEFEAEPLTRGFVLTSIGRRGTPEARTFLEKQLERGESGVRRWAALGLGLWSRRTSDGSVAEAIRSARGREKNHDVLGAYWIALGLARDASSVPTLAKALAEAGDPRERMYAATGLALIGGEAAREKLLGALRRERQANVRVVIAQGLGVLGDPEDAPALASILTSVEDVELQAQVSSAVALHGTPEALTVLRTIAASKEGSTLRRAAALEGLGILLSHSTPLRLGGVSRQANYTVFSEWLNGMFQTTL